MTAESPFEMSSRELSTRLDRVTLIDVREPSEIEHGSLPGAHRIPMGAIAESVGNHPALRDRERDIVVYCAHGIRSLAVVRYLRAQGFPRASNLMGGYAEWLLQAHHGIRQHAG